MEKVKVRLVAESTAIAFGKEVGDEVLVSEAHAKALIAEGRAEAHGQKEDKAGRDSKEDKGATARKTKEEK